MKKFNAVLLKQQFDIALKREGMSQNKYLKRHHVNITPSTLWSSLYRGAMDDGSLSKLLKALNLTNNETIYNHVPLSKGGQQSSYQQIELDLRPKKNVNTRLKREAPVYINSEYLSVLVDDYLTKTGTSKKALERKISLLNGHGALMRALRNEKMNPNSLRELVKIIGGDLEQATTKKDPSADIFSTMSDHELIHALGAKRVREIYLLAFYEKEKGLLN